MKIGKDIEKHAFVIKNWQSDKYCALKVHTINSNTFKDPIPALVEMNILKWNVSKD